MQKVLLISNVFPLENNKSRGCYVLAQAELLKSSNYDVKIINPIPLYLRFILLLIKNLWDLKI